MLPAVVHPEVGAEQLATATVGLVQVVHAAILLALMQVGVVAALVGHQRSAQAPGLVTDLLQLVNEEAIAVLRMVAAQPLPVPAVHEPAGALPAHGLIQIVLGLPQPLLAAGPPLHAVHGIV